MNYAATLKYSLKASMRNEAPFYLTMCAMVILFMFIHPFSPDGSLGAWDGLAAFVAISLATCFKERFHFFIQNGFSRKTLYLNFCFTFLIMAVGMSLFDYVMTLLNNQGLLVYQSFFSMLYEQETIRNFFEYNVWHITFFLASMSIALFMTILFYRMKKWMRIVFFIVLPMVLIIGCPLLEVLFPSLNLMTLILETFLRLLGLYNTVNPYIAIGNFSLITIIAMIASYFAIKKVNLQKA